MNPILKRERRGEIEILTLNRPEKRNALNLELVRALHAALAELETDRDLRAAVLTGEGDHFAAGADIAQLLDRRGPEALDAINGALFTRLEELPVPVIAAVRGYALGGGCELALAADIRVAGESARLGQPEVGLGIIPGAGATYRLPRLVGMGRAKELIFTGRRVEAAEALAMGLVNRVVPDGRMLEEALDVASEVARQSPEAVRIAKLALNAQRHGQREGDALERLAQAVLYQSPEKARRMTAFLSSKGKRS